MQAKIQSIISKLDTDTQECVKQSLTNYSKQHADENVALACVLSWVSRLPEVDGLDKLALDFFVSKHL